MSALAPNPHPPLYGPWAWLGIALKASLFAYFSWQLWLLKGSFFWVFDDTQSYLTPIELWVDGTGYFREGFAAFGEPEFLPFAGRMPGLLPVYGPLYYFFGSAAGRWVLVFLQAVLSTAAGFALAGVTWRLWQSRRIAIGVLLLYLLSYQVHIFDHGGATESLSISASIFSLSAWFRYSETRKSQWLWIAGILFAWTVFLRPVFGAFGIVWLGILLSGGNFREKAGRQIRFFLPLLLALLAWNVRNYVVMERVILLEDAWENSYPHEPEYGADGMAIRRLIKAWGGDILFWNEGSMGNILLSPTPSATVHEGLPARVYCDAYTADSLELLRMGFFLANDLRNSDSARRYWEQKTQERAQRYVKGFREAKPFEAVLLSRVRLLFKFLLLPHPPDFPFPTANLLSPVQLLLKGFYTVYPYLFTLIGLLGFYRAFVWEKGITRLLPLFPLAMIIVLTSVLGMIESRYSLPLWPFFLIYGASMLVNITRYRSEKK